MALTFDHPFSSKRIMQGQLVHSFQQLALNIPQNYCIQDAKRLQYTQTLRYASNQPILNAYARKQSSVEAGILLSPPPPIILMYIADKINCLL
jgi:hypothetical protein